MRDQNQRGVALVIAVPAIACILTFVALVLAVAVLTTNRVRLQNAANLGALAALDKYLSAEGTIEERADAAVEAADGILKGTKLWTIALGERGRLALWSGQPPDGEGRLPTPPVNSAGIVQFGVWSDTPPAPTECQAAPSVACKCIRNNVFHPCFVPLGDSSRPLPQEGGTAPNAVRIVAQTAATLGVQAPFYRMLGGTNGRLDLSVSAISTIYQRCTAFLLDISGSAHAESHIFSKPPYFEVGPTVPRITVPPDPGLYAYKTSDTFPPRCNDIAPYVEPPTPEGTYWCDMYYSGRVVRPPGGGDPRSHYQSDYSIEQSAHGPVLIDKYTPAEPLSSFLLAYNTALRRLESQRSTTDRAMMYPFTGGASGAIPPTGLTNDLRFLIEMTDMRRGGRMEYDTAQDRWVDRGEIFPNFIDRGWFPTVDRGQTNVIDAINKAMNELVSSCSPSGRKAIVLASDGMATVDPMGQTVKSYAGSSRSYQSVERALLTDQNSVLERLLKNKITFTMLLYGESVEPNFRNVLIPGSSPPKFFDILSAAAHGLPAGFFDVSPSLPPEKDRPDDPLCKGSTADDQECARKYAGRLPGVKFRAPNGTFSELAIRSKGLHCPLMKPYQKPDGSINENCYDPDTKDWKPGGGCQRNEGQYQTQAVKGQSVAAQAADCASRTLGPPPYTLVVEDLR